MSETLCHYCDSDRVRLVSSDDGVDVYTCRACGQFFENDTFVSHPKAPTPKNRKVRFDDED